MTPAVRWGVALGVAVAVVQVVFALAGWHRSYDMAAVFLAVVVPLNVIAVLLSLRRTASTTGWVGQVRNAAVLGAVASVIVFVGSWIVSGVMIPDYFDQMAEGYRSAYVARGLSDTEVEELVRATAATSPVRSAFDGVVGTLATSLIVGALAGIWLRRRAAPDPTGG